MSWTSIFVRVKSACYQIAGAPPLSKPRVRFRSTLSIVIVLIASNLSCGSQLLAYADDSIDFQSQVKPILSDHCFACHGPDAQHREAELRFDQLDSVVGEDSYIVPGSLDDSEFWQRIITEDSDLQMPPVDSHKPLSDAQKEVLKRWISQGASYSGHWAFQTPIKPDVPQTESKSGSPIDHFLQQAITNRGLQINPVADRRTLIRRLTLDLTGLPPTVEEIKQFEEDSSPQAYQNLVTRLLASEHFGEQMAIAWLDQARYADTNGYSIDGGRHMWLWRDWVINSFNQNLPYDQFIIQQMAGDLLPNASIQQKVATGFHRNHSITHEGGTIPAENLVNYVADRIKTTGETFMGLTLACAQCHDHKFDPISQRDYYQIFAYFNSVDDRGLDGDGGRNSAPALDAPWMIPNRESEIQGLTSQLEQLKQQLKKPLASQQDWENKQAKLLAARGNDLALYPLPLLKVTEPNRGDPFDVDPTGLVWVPTPSGRSPSFSMHLPVDKIGDRPVTGIRVEFLPDDRLREKGLGHGSHPDLLGNFMLTSFSVSNTEVASDQIDLYRLLDFSQVTASSEHANRQVRDCLDPRDHNGWSPNVTSTAQHITFTFDEPVDAAKSPYLTTQLVWGAGHGLVAGKYRFHAMTGNDDGSELPENIQQLVLKPASERSDVEKATIADYYSSVAPELAQMRADIQTVSKRLHDLSRSHSTMVMNESQNPRPTHILNRGQYDQPGEAVSAGIPAALPKLGQFEPNRLGLAKWLVHSDNPLTARVAVNRFWKQFMGRGLVHPTADFGAQGNPPTHPQLLDYLAVEFVESDWDVKQLIRKIVSTDAYKRSSFAAKQQIQQDPENRWLARASRNRLSAETIRDLALAASGSLVDRLGGPPVFPYQPAGLWREVSHFGSSPATSQVFVPDQGENLYRRSLYTYWKRTVPPPSMVTFDAPNRETCTMDRSNTNTPLQALVLLNDVQFVEAARAMATRVLTERQADEQRLSYAFELATGRLPTEHEVKILDHTLARERSKFSSNTKEASALLESGDSLLPADIQKQELAAWTIVCQMILNLSETITRG